MPEEAVPEEGDLVGGLKWLFLGHNLERHRVTILRDLVVAVQLCPWKYVAGTSERVKAWAVQGLLILSSTEQGVYHRLPVLLTGDFVGAARLMQRLADALHVPYLFCCDAEGWRSEESLLEIARPYELADGKPENAGQINVEGVDDKVPKGKYPKVTKKVGKSPPQYLDEDE